MNIKLYFGDNYWPQCAREKDHTLRWVDRTARPLAVPHASSIELYTRVIVRSIGICIAGTGHTLVEFSGDRYCRYQEYYSYSSSL